MEYCSVYFKLFIYEHHYFLMKNTPKKINFTSHRNKISWKSLITVWVIPTL